MKDDDFMDEESSNRRTGSNTWSLTHTQTKRKKRDVQNDGRTKAVEADSKFKIQSMVLFFFIYIYILP